MAAIMHAIKDKEGDVIHNKEGGGGHQ